MNPKTYPSPAAEVRSRIETFLKQDERFAAIKLYRQETGADLKQAATFIRSEYPEHTPANENGLWEINKDFPQPHTMQLTLSVEITGIVHYKDGADVTFYVGDRENVLFFPTDKMPPEVRTAPARLVSFR